MLGLLLLLVLVLVAALAGPASAKAVKTGFTTTSVAHYVTPPDPNFPDYVGPVVTYSGPHVWHQRGALLMAFDASDDSRLSGVTYLTEDLNFNANINHLTLSMVGHGTYTTYVGAKDANDVLTGNYDGGWEGTFTEKLQIVFDGPPTEGGIPISWSGTGINVGHGMAGSVAGLQVKATTDIDPLTQVVTATGYILDK